MNDAMEYAAALWGLENPEPVSLRPTKAVYTALSRRFGPVVLKINRDRGELKAEYEALSRLSGRCCCRVYAFEEDAGALLEERILPGTRLREEPDTLRDGGDLPTSGRPSGCLVSAWAIPGRMWRSYSLWRRCLPMSGAWRTGRSWIGSGWNLPPAS